MNREDKLKSLLTKEFLSALTEAVKVCGWMVDHIESSDFVTWCYKLADKEPPDLEPYPIEDETEDFYNTLEDTTEIE